MLYSKVGSWPYQETLDKTGMARQWQILELITNIRKLWTKKVLYIETRKLSGHLTHPPNGPDSSSADASIDDKNKNDIPFELMCPITQDIMRNPVRCSGNQQVLLNWPVPTVWLVYNKTSCFEYIKFITEDYFAKHTNITTKLKLKLFTKVIKKPSEEAWVPDRQGV